MAIRCLACSPDQHEGPEEETVFRRGEVFEIQESVFTPIEHILADMHGVSGLAGDALHRSRSSLHSMRTKENATHKCRPCILMNGVRRTRKGMAGCNICLMATFEKTPIEKLPRVFRHFCLQVFTETAPVLETPHLHSLPKWRRRSGMQWIIMWPFDTTRTLGGRWGARPGHGGCGKRTGMAFGENAMGYLDELCEMKDREWKELCYSQPGFAAEQEQEYRVRTLSFPLIRYHVL